MELVAENELGRPHIGEPPAPDIKKEALGPQRFDFTGTGGEYFRIWIVNLLLTIVTLGIYSAWAKVRRLEYFYRNTRVAGSTFDYHGTPGAILKGRILALALFVAYKYSFNISPIVGGGVFLVLVLVMPWLINRAFRFKLANSSYRGLRFHFHGKTRSAYLIYLFPTLTIALIGIVAAIFIPTMVKLNMVFPLFAFGLFSIVAALCSYPMMHYMLKRYQHNNSDYGQSPFMFHATKGDFFKIYGKLLVLMIPLSICMWFFAIFIGKLHIEASLGKIAAFLVSVLIGYFYYFLIASYLGSRIQSLVWERTELVDHRFENKVRARSLLWIHVSNMALIVLTLGLFKPYATIRLLKYRVECMSLIPAGDLEEFLASQFDANVGAIGQEAGDFFDIDIAL